MGLLESPKNREFCNASIPTKYAVPYASAYMVQVANNANINAVSSLMLKYLVQGHG
jgi:hypothetical protein